MTTTILADSHYVDQMVHHGKLIPSSSRPGSGNYALIQQIDEYDYNGRVKSTRLAVCAIGSMHSMRAQYPDAKVKKFEREACKRCGRGLY